MPFLHRYLGNPVLSFLGRLFFKVPIGDFHCGIRAFRADRARLLGLRTNGMEFASELVVRASLANWTITEVPTTLSPDGRTRDPHLRTWRDGWRHLRFLLAFSPRWLFLYPAVLPAAATHTRYDEGGASKSCVGPGGVRGSRSRAGGPHPRGARSVAHGPPCRTRRPQPLTPATGPSGVR
jgi:hypothetical protein